MGYLDERTYVPELQDWLKRNYGTEIALSLNNTLTPYQAELPGGGREFVFLAKCDVSTHEPISSKGVTANAEMGVHLYTEESSLIFGFTIDNTLVLESEIRNEVAPLFLEILKEQDTLTLVIWDSDTSDIVWVTNTFPFVQVKDQFKVAFERYGV